MTQKMKSTFECAIWNVEITEVTDEDVITVWKNNEIRKSDVNLDNKEIEQIEQFCYSRCTITSESGWCKKL